MLSFICLFLNIRFFYGIKLLKALRTLKVHTIAVLTLSSINMKTFGKSFIITVFLVVHYLLS